MLTALSTPGTMGLYRIVQENSLKFYKIVFKMGNYCSTCMTASMYHLIECTVPGVYILIEKFFTGIHMYLAGKSCGKF